MVVTDMAKFLNVEEATFTGQDGSPVIFYRLGFISESDHKPISIVCSKDVYESAKSMSAYDDCLVGVEVFERRGYVKVRVTYIGAPAEGIEY